MDNKDIKKTARESYYLANYIKSLNQTSLNPLEFPIVMHFFSVSDAFGKIGPDIIIHKIIEKQTGMFKYTLLATGVKIENDIVGTEQLSDLVHTETQTIVADMTMSEVKEDLRRFMGWVGLRQPTIPNVNPERPR